MARIPKDLVYHPKAVQIGGKGWWESFDENWKKLVALDEEAKKRGLYVGRYITHPYADGRAVYQIVAESAKRITIEVVTGIGDDWVLPAWGERAIISKDYADNEFNFREYWGKTCSTK